MPVPQQYAHTLEICHSSRGDAAMKKRVREEPNIVETYKIGNSTIHIASNSFVKTREEHEAIIARMHAIGFLIEEEIARKELASSKG